jgi:MFS family permease
VSTTPAVPARLFTGRFVLTTLSTFCYFTSLAMLVPTIPRYVRDELGGGGLQVGLAVGAFAFAAGALRPFAGRLGDERGRRLIVVGGSGLFAVTVLGYSLASSLVLLILARAIGGIGEAGMWVGSATTSQDLAPPDRRAEAASYYSVALYGGMAIGPPLGESLVHSHGYDTLWVVASCVALAACVLGLRTPPRSGPPPERGPLLQRNALAPGVVLLLGMIPFMGFSAYLPVYSEHIGMKHIGPVFGLYAVIVLSVRIFGARIPDRVGLNPLATAALGSNTIAAIVLVLWADPAGVWVAAAIFAIGGALLFPALFSYVIGGVSDSERSRAVGTFSIFFDLAGGIGVPLLGAVVSIANERTAFGATIACGVLALMALQRVPAAPGHADMGVYAESIAP